MKDYITLRQGLKIRKKNLIEPDAEISILRLLVENSWRYSYTSFRKKWNIFE